MDREQLELTQLNQKLLQCLQLYDSLMQQQFPQQPQLHNPQMANYITPQPMTQQMGGMNLQVTYFSFLRSKMFMSNCVLGGAEWWNVPSRWLSKCSGTANSAGSHADEPTYDESAKSLRPTLRHASSADATTAAVASTTDATAAACSKRHAAWSNGAKPKSISLSTNIIRADRSPTNTSCNGNAATTTTATTLMITLSIALFVHSVVSPICRPILVIYGPGWTKKWNGMTSSFFVTPRCVYAATRGRYTVFLYMLILLADYNIRFTIKLATE